MEVRIVNCFKVKLFLELNKQDGEVRLLQPNVSSCGLKQLTYYPDIGYTALMLFICCLYFSGIHAFRCAPRWLPFPIKGKVKIVRGGQPLQSIHNYILPSYRTQRNLYRFHVGSDKISILIYFIDISPLR